MSLHRRAAKRDAAEPAIVSALEALGCVVWRVSGKGLPDLIVLRAGKKWLADVKGPKEKPTPAQAASWTVALAFARCAVFILRTPEDAKKMLNNALQPWEPDLDMPAPIVKMSKAEMVKRFPRKGDAAKAEAFPKGGAMDPATASGALKKFYPNYTPPRSTSVDAVATYSGSLGDAVREFEEKRKANPKCDAALKRALGAAKEAEATFAPSAIPPCPDCGEAYESKCYDRTAPVGAVSCTKDVHCVRYEGHDGDCQTLGARCCAT